MTHPTHKTRYSDSSLYDEVCVKCGATDGRSDDRLDKPCSKEANKAEPYKGPMAIFNRI